MNKIFDVDNPVWSTLSKVVDLILLNIIFILCLIPIVTIPASVTALYYTTMRMASGRLTYVTSDFWKSFKENFKQGLISGIIIFDVVVILIWGTYLSFASDAYVGKALFTVLDFMAAAVISYMYPVLAKFQISTAQQFRNSAIFAVRYVPFSILNVLILFLFGYVMRYNFAILIVGLVIGCAAIALLQSVWFNYIFSKYLPEEEKELDAVLKQEVKTAKKEKKAGR